MGNWFLINTMHGNAKYSNTINAEVYNIFFPNIILNSFHLFPPTSLFFFFAGLYFPEMCVFPTACLNQMRNTCSAANIITLHLLSNNSPLLQFPQAFLSSFSPFSHPSIPSIL